MAKPIYGIMILDGFGYNPKREGNAILSAGTPNIDKLSAHFPHTLIAASGMDVGLPEGQMGNSEVGHLNIGAGRIVYQEFTRITKSILDGDFFENKAFLSAVEAAKKSGGKLHLMGLLSDGGVHSHMDHLLALVDLAKQQGLDNVYIHAFMDGRDVPPASGKGFVQQLEGELAKKNFGAIATVIGRYYAMDRDKRWERVSQAYNAIAKGEGVAAASAEAAMQQSYDAGELDEFVKPSVVQKDGKPVATVEAGDAVIFFNFRPDRAREITRTLIEPNFADFERGEYKPVTFVSLTQYDATFENLTVAFHPQSLDGTLGQMLAQHGKTQLRIAETEKYAHVTFFFNGGVEEPNPGEERSLIPSPKVATYDLQPEMSAYEVADDAVKRIQSGKYDAMILNFANPDMVGHTGVMEAAEKAVRTVDECAAKVIDAVLATGGGIIVTADHGNADQMIDEVNGGAFTAHTTNPVPVIVVDERMVGKTLREGGRLADLAPTLLQLMGLPVPQEMTGTTLVKG